MDNCYDGSKIITNPYLFKEDNKKKDLLDRAVVGRICRVLIL